VAQRHAQATRPAASPRPAVAAATPQAQDLKSIQGIDPAAEAKLKALGISRYEQIAAWLRADVERVEQALGQRGRVARENWIEQAQILAKGGQTLFSVRRARGEGSTAAPTPDEGVTAAPASAAALPRPMSRVGVSAAVIAPQPDAARPAAVAALPLVSDRAAFAQQPAVPIRPSEPPARDNLQRIGGITAEIENKLNGLGIARYSEIAQWSPAAVERIDKEIGTAGRISRENWIEQAQILSRGGDTRFSREFDRCATAQSPAGPPPRPIKLPDAIREHEAAMAAGQAAAPQRPELGALRSVRSQAYQDTTEPGPEAARRAASRKVRAGQADDLKRIRGIGVLIEKKLNSLGVATYEDIANWTSEDIDRISESLDFKGRIQRENWVEQARILAAGGDTEFSRRTDRK
jgi:predicted flap endonuclease-1-like 5' DNA nuclease